MNEMDDNDFIGPSNIVRRRSIAPETQLHDFPIINQQIKVDIPESSHGDNVKKRKKFLNLFLNYA